MMVLAGQSALFATEKVEVHGHRGASAKTENTIAAFEYAMEQGADAVELDLAVTKDDHVLVTHDSFIPERCTDPAGRKVGKHRIYVRDLTLAEVKGFDCVERLDTLDEVFTWIRESKHPRAGELRFTIEIKTDPANPARYPKLPTYIGLMLDSLRRGRIDEKRLLIQSFDVDALREVRKQRPSLKVAILSGSQEEALKSAREIGASAISVYFPKLTAEGVADAHSSGIRVLAWTVNKTEDVRKLIGIGVDGIITDEPGMLVEMLNRASRKESPHDLAYCRGTSVSANDPVTSVLEESDPARALEEIQDDLLRVPPRPDER